jgi:hypothetical protein
MLQNELSAAKAWPCSIAKKMSGHHGHLRGRGEEPTQPRTQTLGRGGPDEHEADAHDDLRDQEGERCGIERRHLVYDTTAGPRA